MFQMFEELFFTDVPILFASSCKGIEDRSIHYLSIQLIVSKSSCVGVSTCVRPENRIGDGNSMSVIAFMVVWRGNVQTALRL